MDKLFALPNLNSKWQIVMLSDEVQNWTRIPDNNQRKLNELKKLQGVWGSIGAMFVYSLRSFMR